MKIPVTDVFPSVCLNSLRKGKAWRARGLLLKNRRGVLGEEIWWKHCPPLCPWIWCIRVLLRSQGECAIHSPWWKGSGAIGTWLRIGHNSWKPEVKLEHTSWCERETADCPVMAYVPLLGASASLNIFSVCFPAGILLGRQDPGTSPIPILRGRSWLYPLYIVPCLHPSRSTLTKAWDLSYFTTFWRLFLGLGTEQRTKE